MSARRTAIQVATKATIGFAALFLVSVLLAAMPGHHAPTVGSTEVNAAAVQRRKNKLPRNPFIPPCPE